MDILEQLGITKEELIDRITEKALGLTADTRAYPDHNGEPVWEEIPFSSVIDTKINGVIDAAIKGMSAKIEERVSELITAKVDTVLCAPFQRVDRWGTAIGSPTTIKDLIADKTESYWKETVDRNGKTDGYDRKPRHEWYSEKVMDEYYRKELEVEVKKLAEAMKKAIPDTISKEISATITKYLR